MRAYINLKKGVNKIKIERSDFWSPRDIIGKILYKLIKDFRKSQNDIPISYYDQEEWNKILDKMVEGFKIVAKDNFWGKERERNKQKAQEAFDLLAKHWGALWD